MKTVLVYGATGSQSRPVAHRLLDAGFRVRVLTRDPAKAADLARRGAQVARADIADRDALREAHHGVDAVSLLIPAFLDDPSSALDLARNAVDAARDVNVDVVVWNASGQINERGDDALGPDVRRATLAHLQASGVPHVVLQPTGYMENMLGPWTAPRVQSDDVLQYPTQRAFMTQWIATDDVAALAVEAIKRPALADLNLKVAGPERLDGDGMAASFSRALGRTIRYEALTPTAFGAILARLFGPEAGEAAARGYEAIARDPDLFSPTVDMDSVLPMLPVTLTSLESWVRQHAQAFAPAAQSAAT